MNVHEYQAKELFRAYGIPVADGLPAGTAEQARAAAERLGPCVVKAQVHAGGRGKAGGVKRADTPAEAEAAAAALLGSTLVTKQTGPAGKPVAAVYLEKACAVARELYFSILIDPACACPVAVASAAGGMDIETVARETPERVLRAEIDPLTGLCGYQCWALADGLGLEGGEKKAFVRCALAAWRLFSEKDCALLEINPLAVTPEGGLLALDAKLDFDSSALFRHPEIEALRDRGQEQPLEARAFDAGLSYVSLEGDIGCLVVGAGLAMATMDAIQYFGGSPANFLDCGSRTAPEDACEAVNIILAEPRVRGVLVNIFGGITQTDRIAEGILAAARTKEAHIPLVVRLEGTNSDRANELLRQSGLDVHPASSLTEGAGLVLELVRQREER